MLSSVAASFRIMTLEFTKLLDKFRASSVDLVKTILGFEVEWKVKQFQFKEKKATNMLEIEDNS